MFSSLVDTAAGAALSTIVTHRTGLGLEEGSDLKEY